MSTTISGRNPNTGNIQPIIVDEAGRLLNDTLGVPGEARQVTVTTTSANTQLTAGVRRVSLKARTCDMRYAVGATAQTASATASHFIEAGERLDIAVPAGGHIAVIRDSAATANGTLCITEPGDPEAVTAACNAAGLEVTLEQVDAIFNAADVTDQEPFTAMARMGLRIVQPPIDLLEQPAP